MKTIMIYALLALLGFNCQSCGGKNTKDRSKMTKFVWGPSVSTPKYFDIWMKYALVGFGNKGRRYPAISYSRIGIGQGTSSVSLNDFEGGMSLPNALDISWLSNVDRKIYKGNFEFSEELQNKILCYFRTGYKIYERRDSTLQDITYDGINVSIIPGGRVLLYLKGLGRIVCLDTVLQCDPVNVNWKQYYTYLGYETLDSYVDKCNTEEDGPAMMALLEQYGHDYIYNLWNRYMERFNYDINIEFENKETIINPNYGYKFTNGEMFKNLAGVNVDMKARIKTIGFSWSIADTTYSSNFFFNEDDVLNIFEQAYGNDRTQKGELSIRVSKYNNWFDIFLRVGEKEFQFDNVKRTQIHVFRHYPGQDADLSDEVFYNNHRSIHSSKIKFIGE